MRVNMDKSSLLSSLQKGVHKKEQVNLDNEQELEYPSDAPSSFNEENIVDAHLEEDLETEDVGIEDVDVEESSSETFNEDNFDNTYEGTSFNFSSLDDTDVESGYEEKLDNNEDNNDNTENEEDADDDFDMEGDEEEEEEEDTDSDEDGGSDFDMDGDDDEEEEEEDKDNDFDMDGDEDEDDDFDMDGDDEEDEFDMDGDDDEEEEDKDFDMDGDDDEEDEDDGFDMNGDDDEDDDFDMDGDADEDEDGSSSENEFDMFKDDDESFEEEVNNVPSEKQTLVTNSEKETETKETTAQNTGDSNRRHINESIQTSAVDSQSSNFSERAQTEERVSKMATNNVTPTEQRAEPVTVANVPDNLNSLLDVLTVKDTNESIKEDINDQSKNIVYHKGMRLDEFLRSNPSVRGHKEVSEYYCKEDISSAIKYGLVQFNSRKKRFFL